jgi:hypothetical protein
MLTEAQRTTIKADILANQDTADKFAIGDLSSLAELYNAAAAPAFVVWKSILTAQQARTAIASSSGLAQLDALTAGKRDSLLWVLEGDTQPSSATQRAAIDDLCGSQNNLKAAILAAQKLTASRIEKLFATGTGSDASPAVMAVEGPIGYEIFIGL